MRNTKGFSTMMALGLAGFVALLAVVWSMTREQQLKTVKYMEQRAAGESLRRQVSQLFQDGTLCSCHVNGSIDTSTRTFDATQTNGSSTLTLDFLRTSCAPAAPILVTKGQKLPSGVTIDRIELANLKPSSGTTWDADYRISWVGAGLTAMKPMEIPVRVQLDATSFANTPAQTQVASCLPATVATGLIQYCAAGYAMVGPPGGVGTYCIETNEHGPVANYNGAIVACASPAPSSQGFAHLCNHSEWYIACRTVSGLSAIVDGWEWNVEFAGNDTQVVASGSGGDCNSSSKQNVNILLKYRCCYP